MHFNADSYKDIVHYNLLVVIIKCVVNVKYFNYSVLLLVVFLIKVVKENIEILNLIAKLYCSIVNKDNIMMRLRSKERKSSSKIKEKR